MRKILSLSVMFLVTWFYSQTINDLKFDSNVPDAENNYVAVPRDKPEDGYGFGYVYFDDVAGYTYHIMGSLSVENGKLKLTKNADSDKGATVQRIGNLEFKSAKIPVDMLNTFNVPVQPEWLKFYKSSAPVNEQQLERASKMNGLRFSNLALPRLQKLYKEGYKTPKLYFELAFAYNVLKEFAQAEKISAEAISVKKADDYVLKENLFALVNQSKIMDAEKFLQSNLKAFKNIESKAESIINLIAYSNHLKQKNTARKWVDIFKKEITTGNYNSHIENLEKMINENDSTSK